MIGPGEAERMIVRHRLVSLDPLVHPPEMSPSFLRSRPSELTSRATSGSCSVGPIGPQMPTGFVRFDCRHASMYSRASAR